MRTATIIALLFFVSAAYAQAPSPAQMGITPATPQSLQVLDKNKVWVPLGTLDPTTHTFGSNVDPRDYGAKCDGTTDDSAALNAAATAAKVAGKTLSIPNAVCYSASALNLGSLPLVGATPLLANNPLQGAMISCSASIAAPCVTVGVPSTGVSGATVRDVAFSFVGTPTAGDAALNVQGYNSSLSNVAVYNAWDGYLFSNGIAAHAVHIYSGRIYRNHVVQNGFPEIYLTNIRLGMNGSTSTSDVNGNAFFGITGADPNSLVCVGCQLNQGGGTSPKYVYDFVGLTSQGNGVYTLSNAVIDFGSSPNATAVIHGDGTGTCLRCLWDGVTIVGAPTLPFFALGAATSMNQASFTNSNFFVGSFTLPPIHYVGLRLSNLYILGSLTIANDTGSAVDVSNVSTGGAIVVGGTAWTSLHLNSLFGASYTDVAATGAVYASNVPMTNWTPRLSFGGANVGMTTTATYGKSSRQPDGTVKQIFGVGLTAVGSSTGAVTIEGAPYACNSYGLGQIGLGPLFLSAMTALPGPLFAYGRTNNTSIGIKTVGSSNLNDISQANFTSSSIISGTVTCSVP